MSYSIETYDKAQNILDRRKEKATLEAQSRIDKLCAEIPELNVINRKLAQIGLNISRTFFTSRYSDGLIFCNLEDTSLWTVLLLMPNFLAVCRTVSPLSAI